MRIWSVTARSSYMMRKNMLQGCGSQTWLHVWNIWHVFKIISVCLSLYKCRFNYVGGKVSLSRDVSQMTRKCSQTGSDCCGIMCSYSSSWTLWMVIYILEFTRQPPQKSYLNSDEQCIFRQELTFLKINEVMIYKILLYELDMSLKLRLSFW